MTDLSEMNEKELREVKALWPKTEEELLEYIHTLATRNHDYGTCVYAMSLASIAAFNYISHVLGVTGFQAGCADLDFLRLSRHMDGPFALIKGEDMLYPQYNIVEKVYKCLDEWEDWASEEAQKFLDKNDKDQISIKVWKHWEDLANGNV